MFLALLGDWQSLDLGLRGLSDEILAGCCQSPVASHGALGALESSFGALRADHGAAQLCPRGCLGCCRDRPARMIGGRGNRGYILALHGTTDSR